MPLSIPTKITGDLLTAAEFNELLAAVNDFVDDNFTIPSSVVSDFDASVTANADVAASKVVTDFITVTAPIDLDNLSGLEATDIDTLLKLNTIITDATLIDTADARLSDARTPTAHTHTEADITDLQAYLLPADIDTLAELNAIIGDATLIDTADGRLSDARTPTAHTHTESEITDLQAYLLTADLNTLAKLNAIVADATLIDTGDARLSDARTPTAHTHTASEITDYASTLAGTTNTTPFTPSADNHVATKKYVDDAIIGGGGYTDEQAQDAVGTILTDSAEIDFTYDDITPTITAAIVAGSIDETKLDISVNASLDLADTSIQTADINSLADLNSIVADATLIDTNDARLSDTRDPNAHTHTASEVTDFDTEVSNNTSVAANTAKISYTDATAVGLNTTHRTSNGSDHSFIDQDVTSGASPTFNGVNITGLTVGATQQLYINVRAGTSTIAAGQPVYISAYNVGGWYDVELADASSGATMPAAGITTTSTTTIATQPLAISGRLTGIDTSTFTLNDGVWVASGGGLTATRPSGTNLVQKMGSISRVHPSAGVMIVSGAGRTNDVPNLPNNNIWLGDGTGTAITTDLDTEIAANSAVTANTAKTSYPGPQTSIVGITGTKAEFNTELSDGSFMFIGDAPTSHTHTESDITDLQAYLLAADLNTLAKLNAIVVDATLIDTADARLSDARTPTAHTHASTDITDWGTYINQAVTSGSAPVLDATNFTNLPVYGDVSATGTPLDNQLAVWTAADTIEGTTLAALTASGLAINGSRTTQFNKTLDLITSDMIANDWSQITIGKAKTAKNCAEFSYIYKGAGLDTNYFSLGLYNNQCLELYGDQSSAFLGDLVFGGEFINMNKIVDANDRRGIEFVGGPTGLLATSVLISADGSTAGKPALFGHTNLTSGTEGARWQFGDAWNVIENQYGNGMVLRCYHTMVLDGGAFDAVAVVDYTDSKYATDTAEGLRVLLQDNRGMVLRDRDTGTRTVDWLALQDETGAEIRPIIDSAGYVPFASIADVAVHEGFAVGDQTNVITTGTVKYTFSLPYAMNVTSAYASLKTVSSSGVVTFDINDDGATMLSTKLTIDVSEKNSSTAAAPVVISGGTWGIAAYSEITVDIDTAGTGAIGPVVWIIGTRA